MPKVTINGIEIEAEKGMTIIQAADAAGLNELKIPRFCYHPDLPIDGNCRMCLVEVEKMPKLVIACNTPVTDGMVVHSQNDRVKEAVRGVLEFLLINHPVDCPICDQAGECWLQDYYMKHGLYQSRIDLDEKIHKRKAVDLGPMVVLDSERCVHCSRCVRFTEVVTKTGEMAFFNRGGHVEIGTIQNRPVLNPYSGNIVDVCPVGALTSKDFRFQSRVWFLKNTESICGGCSTGCNVRLDHKQSTIYRMIARRNTDVNKSWLCDEGRLSFHSLQNSARLSTALSKGVDGPLIESTFENAIALMESGISGVVAKHGAGSVIGFGSAGTSNESLYMMKRYLTEKYKINRFEFRLEDEDKKVEEREDELLRRKDKRPNTQGATSLGFVDQVSGIKGAAEAAKSGNLKGAVLIYQPRTLGQLPAESIESLKTFVDSLEFCAILTPVRESWQDGASVLIPIGSWAEEEGTYTNFSKTVQRAGRAWAPKEQAKEAREIFAVLLGLDRPGFYVTQAEEIFTEMTKKLPDFAGLTYEGLASNRAKVPPPEGRYW